LGHPLLALSQNLEVLLSNFTLFYFNKLSHFTCKKKKKRWKALNWKQTQKCYLVMKIVCNTWDKRLTFLIHKEQCKLVRKRSTPNKKQRTWISNSPKRKSKSPINMWNSIRPGWSQKTATFTWFLLAGLKESLKNTNIQWER
jgi:hypothetical protein